MLVCVRHWEEACDAAVVVRHWEGAGDAAVDGWAREHVSGICMLISSFGMGTCLTCTFRPVIAGSMSCFI